MYILFENEDICCIVGISEVHPISVYIVVSVPKSLFLWYEVGFDGKTGASNTANRGGAGGGGNDDVKAGNRGCVRGEIPSLEN